ncbi:DUF881 domain-containing protein [Georgenia yuyongxinii]|uniref:DUF881 domain-containing protein n=1 Tax=Georgenia yuyongxinii TaxID=2589797 RepID=A0A5B8C996_9MICO|nr:DUF881 domain-containing protein [Georgenia yuyongxinii]QDC24616.1 DUF881 domain-containing protein [Georgenia yuyongxinii]
MTGEHSSKGTDRQPAGRPDAERNKPDQPEPQPAAPRWRTLLTPRLNNTQLIAFVLCAALGFGVVVQVRQTHDDALAGMRQDDLVRLLDELTRRNADLAEEQQQLRSDLSDLRSSSSSREAAATAAAEQARVQGVLAGTLPVRGPGIRLRIDDPQGGVRAQTLVTILEELRNSGAESVELSGQRITASSWILDDAVDGVVVDGVAISPPYEWVAIGDPDTMAVALGIPGGALAAVRNAGGEADVDEVEDLEITSVRPLEPPEHATPAPANGDG